MNNIFDEIKLANNITIFSHMRTDGDAVASSLALFCYLKKIGKNVSIAIDSEIPTNLKFLKDIDEVNNNIKFSGDLAIILDCMDQDRLGRFKFKLSKFKRKVQIDHHLGNTNFAHINYNKPDYSSTCEYLYDLFVKFNVAIDKDMAYYLLAGILTDTGGMRFSTTSPDTFRKVASLIEICNISIDEIYVPLFSSLTKEMFDLKKLAYEKIEFYNNNQIAFIAISGEDLKNTNVSLNDTKIVLEVGMSLASVKVMVSLCEGEDGEIFVSFRSKDDTDVSKYAAEFGGGGHKQASGCRIYDTLENTKAKVLKVIGAKC